jgi:multiple antibiotic resistance protein
MRTGIFSAAVTLFLIMDPLGNIPVFLSALQNVEPKRRTIIIIRETLIALLVMILFLLVGQYLLDFLGLKQESISIAGGIILFLIALKMIFPREKSEIENKNEEEPFIVPLAIPLIAGPSLLATLLLFVRSEPDRMFDWLFALLIAWGISSLILLASPFVQKVLKERGLIAVERLMGMILVALSVQMFLNGVAEYLKK